MSPQKSWRPEDSGTSPLKSWQEKPASPEFYSQQKYPSGMKRNAFYDKDTFREFINSRPALKNPLNNNNKKSCSG